MKLQYTRILVKLSGEQLSGEHQVGIDKQVAASIADQIAQAVSVGAEVVVMVGGGNFVRGAQIEGSGIRRVTGDFMGMLATLINALALQDIFAEHSVPASVLTNIVADQAADQYTQRRAVHHLAKGRVVIVGGGIGRPYLTTDTAAVSLALELDCEVVVKLTKVDGVFNKDPQKYSDARHLPRLSFQRAIEDSAIKVMDKAALGLAMEHTTPIIVCELTAPDTLKRLIIGEPTGTIIT
ncbi:MAG TPA: UMP kinase [Candidatus Saccharimonadales bacterium]|nr:UMP kinase [Candidatus Saccharimonadales bacterium]